jgi:hypothetical protein
MEILGDDFARLDRAQAMTSAVGAGDVICVDVTDRGQTVVDNLAGFN